MAPAGVIPHNSPPARVVQHSCPRASEVCFVFHFFEGSNHLLGLVLPRGCPLFVIVHARVQGKSEPAGQRAHWTRDRSAHLYSEFWVQSDYMTTGHCHCHMVHVHSSSHVARASTGEPPLEGSSVYQSAGLPRYQVGLEVTPDSGGSTCRSRVDNECSSAASRDGSTD